MIDFAMHPPDPFDFTFWAFPVDRWETVVPAYLKFCEDTAPQFRASLFTEVYLISKDDNAALSFCPDTDVFTLDMVDHRPRLEARGTLTAAAGSRVARAESSLQQAGHQA